MANGTKPRTSVYIDAFNLYFGAIKDTPHRWLNIHAMCQAYLPHNDITAIKYFTAKISARPNDLQQPIRQQTYLRALATLPELEIIYGHYLSHVVRARLANPPPGGPATVEIIKTEEKGSDVNLATHLVHDAHLNRFDIAVVVSNDSDLLMPIQLVRTALGKKNGILNPHKNPSRALLPHIDFIKQIRAAALAASQFPAQVVNSKGQIIHKPTGW
jgi:NYN domain